MGVSGNFDYAHNTIRATLIEEHNQNINMANPDMEAREDSESVVTTPEDESEMVENSVSQNSSTIDDDDEYE